MAEKIFLRDKRNEARSSIETHTNSKQLLFDLPALREHSLDLLREGGRKRGEVL